MPLISSSVSNDMKCVSVWINRALNDTQQEVATLLPDNVQSICITAARSWIYQSAGDMLSSYMHGVHNMPVPLLLSMTYSPEFSSAYTLKSV